MWVSMIKTYALPVMSVISRTSLMPCFSMIFLPSFQRAMDSLALPNFRLKIFLTTIIVLLFCKYFEATKLHIIYLIHKSILLFMTASIFILFIFIPVLLHCRKSNIIKRKFENVRFTIWDILLISRNHPASPPTSRFAMCFKNNNFADEAICSKTYKTNEH